MSETNDSKICMIEIPKGGLDNDYTFYESGKIYHMSDRHIYPGGQNREAWITAESINDSEKQRLIEKCPPKHLEKITKILNIQHE